MRLVVDTNILFAGILRDGTTRGLLIDSPLDLLAPERMLAEIRRNADAIAERSGLSIDGVELLLALLTEDIEVVPRETFEEQLPKAKRRIGDQDPGDVPFLALALAQPCEGIWTQNAQDFENGGVDVWSTKRVVEWIEQGL
jgi:predicted nucleic acid-binding protein